MWGCTVQSSMSSQPLIHGVSSISLILSMGPISPTNFPPQFQLPMANSFCCNSYLDDDITTNSSTCHDSCAVVACAKICSDHFIRNWIKNVNNDGKNCKWNDPLPLLPNISSWVGPHKGIPAHDWPIKLIPGLNGSIEDESFDMSPCCPQI